MQVQREQQQCRRAGPSTFVRSVVLSARGERTRTSRIGNYRKKPRNYRNIRQKVVEIDSQIYSTSNRNVCGLKIARFRAVFRC